MWSQALWMRALVMAAAVGPMMAQTVETPVAPIRIEGGLIAGKVLPSGVKAWLGVPYAAPPVGELRWKPPQPMTWKGVWDADRLMPECMQVLRPHGINHYFGEEATSENCLYLNVWAPAHAEDGAKLPVIVFIYGGGYTIGSSGMAPYSGEEIAKHGAVFVNLNYRVGILGFMAHPELTKEQGGHSGDYAFLDQNAALKWVQANIAKFGGDPAKVLLMGQSAGAMSVTQQIFSPLSKGLFRAAVMSSGCIWSSKGLSVGGFSGTLQTGEATGLQIQKLLGAVNLEEMRQAPADRILSLQSEFQIGLNNPGVRAVPIIDGYFMPKTIPEILKAHEDNDVPIIASSTNDDFDSASSALTQATTVAEYKAIAEKMYGDNATEFLKLYPVSSDADVWATSRRAVQDAALQENSRDCADLKTKYDTTAAYIDLFSRKHPYAPGVKIADQNTATIGAYHTSDIPYWFGTLEAYNSVRPTRVWTDWDRKLADDMMGSLIAFANTGSPSTPAVEWPAWSATREERVGLGNTIQIEKLNTTGMDWLAAHPAKPVPRTDAAGRPRARD